MIVRRLHPDLEVVELDAEGSRERLAAWYALPSDDWVRLNLVASVTGSAVGDDGTSETLTNATDRRILGVIRSSADVVLVGAASVRAEGYQVPRHARLAIVTRSGRLDGHRIDGDRQTRVTVICPPAAVARVRSALPGCEILAVPGGDDIAPPAIIATLTTAGYRKIVCEGGPALASSLLGARLVDEVCLTTSPKLRDVTVPAFAAHGIPEAHLRLTTLCVDDDSYVFTRWSTRAQ